MLLDGYKKFRRLILLGGLLDLTPERMRALDNDEVLFREALANWEDEHAYARDVYATEIDEGLIKLRQSITVPQLHSMLGTRIDLRRRDVPELQAMLDSVPLFQEPFLLPIRSPTGFIDHLRIMWIATVSVDFWAEVLDSTLERRPQGYPADMSPELRLWLTREWLATYIQPLLMLRRYISQVDAAMFQEDGGVETARNVAAIEQFKLHEMVRAFLAGAPALRMILDVPDDDDDFRHLVKTFDEALPN
jgi:hypothetical protein